MILEKLKELDKTRQSDIVQASLPDPTGMLQDFLANLPEEIRLIGTSAAPGTVDLQFVLLPGNIYFDARYIMAGDVSYIRLGTGTNSVNDPDFWNRSWVLKGIYEAAAVKALPHRINWERL